MDLRPFHEQARGLPLAPRKWVVHITHYAGGEAPGPAGAGARVSPPVTGESFVCLVDSEEEAKQKAGEAARRNPQNSCGFRRETEEEVRWRMAAELAYAEG